MPDDADPPRQFFRLKPTEFERVNQPSKDAPPPLPTAADPGIVQATTGRIDVRDLARVATGQKSPLGTNSVANRANEVHDTLKSNYERDRATGAFHVVAGPNKKRQREIRNYCIGIVVTNAGLGGFAWMIGPGAAIPFVCSLAAMGMITAVLTWRTFFLRT